MKTKGPAATATDGVFGGFASGLKAQIETGASSNTFSDRSVVPV